MFNLKYLKLTHKDGEFPHECYNKAWDIIKTGLANGGVSGAIEAIKSDIFTFSSCLFSIVSWFLGSINNEDSEPTVIGQTGPTESALESIEKEVDFTSVSEMEAAAELPPVMGNIRGFLTRRFIQMAMAYLMAALNDSNEVKKYLDQVSDWIEEQLK